MNQFKKAFKGIDSAIKQGTARALNRALSSTKTKVTRQLRQDTGLKTDLILARLRARKAKTERLDAILAIAVKFDIPLTEFKPKVKKIRKKPVGGKRARTYEGVTVKIGQQARQLAPGAFFLGRNSSVVIQRQGADRLPTRQPKSDAFRDSARTQQDGAQAYLAETFDRIVSHEIDYAIQKKFSGNK